MREANNKRNKCLPLAASISISAHINTDVVCFSCKSHALGVIMLNHCTINLLTLTNVSRDMKARNKRNRNDCLFLAASFRNLVVFATAAPTITALLPVANAN